MTDAIDNAQHRVVALQARREKRRRDRAQFDSNREWGVSVRHALRVPLDEVAYQLASWAPPGPAGTRAVQVSERAWRVSDGHQRHPSGFCAGCGPACSWPCRPYVLAHRDALEALRDLGRDA